jgi:hypothetical protein
MDEMELQLAIFYGFLGLVAIIFVLKTLRGRGNDPEAAKSTEVIQLIEEVIDYQSHLDHARELESAREDALQKIKAICDPLGVQVEIKSKSNTPVSFTIHLTSSIDNIRNLRFLNEHLTAIEELSHVYNENDPRAYLKPIIIKYRRMYDKLMNDCTTERWNSFREDKKAIVEAISDRYDKEHAINNTDQENLIAQ